jgi:signal transduction histidine kinase
MTNGRTARSNDPGAKLAVRCMPSAEAYSQARGGTTICRLMSSWNSSRDFNPILDCAVAAMTTHDISNEDLEILAVAALRLLGSGAGAVELAERFSGVHIPREPADAAALLAHLAKLGLVIVAATRHGESRYVLTTLGQQYADTLPGGSRALSAGLEELEYLRTDFMSTIAHELRTPLTALQTSISLLRDPSVAPGPAMRARLLENVARSAGLMERLVTDLLDLTRFRAGQIQLQPQRFDARSLTRDAGSAITPLMEDHGQVLEVTVPAAPVWVYADRRRLEQVLLNLLSNSQKFSPDGAPISLSLQADEEGGVAWTVTDHGPGIEPEDQRRLFERFFIGKGDTVGRKAGAGLGLPIALTIAQEHGGTITVDSVVGRGSRFTLFLPRYPEVEVDSE